MTAAVDRAELARRHAQIRTSMATEGIGLLLVYASPLNSMNVHYGRQAAIGATGAAPFADPTSLAGR